ncbi:MAG: hypothetical protein AB7O77_07055 [Phycisphaerales bacterium]
MPQTGEIPAPMRLGKRIVRWGLSDLREHLHRTAAGASGLVPPTGQRRPTRRELARHPRFG